MIKSLSDRVELNNGTKIPGLGLGVFQIPEDQTAEVVKNGIINGYRLIDTAAIYGNEKGTGIGIKEGLKATGLKREDLFITSKVWNNHSWSPLMQGQLLKNEVILDIAKKHNKSAAQVILRWDIQQDILLNVKSVHTDRMISNASVFDFELDDEDMDRINMLNEDLRVGPNPDEFDF